MIKLDWDSAKAKANLTKHGISFSEVEPAFYDNFALSMPDVFSLSEERFVLIGRDARNRVLTVSYLYRGEGIRVISARPATKAERRSYEKGIRF
jgi:uncharacterized DUF497 family protein